MCKSASTFAKHNVEILQALFRKYEIPVRGGVIVPHFRNANVIVSYSLGYKKRHGIAYAFCIAITI